MWAVTINHFLSLLFTNLFQPEIISQVTCDTSNIIYHAINSQLNQFHSTSTTDIQNVYTFTSSHKTIHFDSNIHIVYEILHSKEEILLASVWFTDFAIAQNSYTWHRLKI